MTLRENVVHTVFTGNSKQLEQAQKNAIRGHKQVRVGLEGNVQVSEQLVTESKRYGRVVTDITNKERGFKMELLSVMFAGMALERVFGGQIDRMKELTGQAAMVEAFYTTALIGPMTESSERMSKYLELWLQLPEDVQSGVGSAMINIKRMGTALSTTGQLWLGLRGIEDMFGINIPKSIGKTIAKIPGIGTALRNMGAVAKGGVWALLIVGSLIWAKQTFDDIVDLKEDLQEVNRLAKVGGDIRPAVAEAGEKAIEVRRGLQPILGGMTGSGAAMEVILGIIIDKFRTAGGSVDQDKNLTAYGLTDTAYPL